MTFFVRQIFVLLCIAPASACKTLRGGSAITQPQDIPPETAKKTKTPLFIAPDGMEWYFQGNRAGLSVLFDQRTTKTMTQATICSFNEDDWYNMRDALTSAHAELRSPNTTAIASKLAKRWVDVIPNDQTLVAFSQRQIGGDASVGVTFVKGIASGEVGASASKESLALLVGDRRKTVVLKPEVLDCILASLCIDNPTGGEYIESVDYGSLVWLEVDSSKYDVAVDANALKFVTIHGSLSGDNLTITGGLVGSFSGGAVQNAYGTQRMIEHINQKDSIAVQRGLRSIADTVDIISLTRASYTSDQCQAVAATIEQKAKD